MTLAPALPETFSIAEPGVYDIPDAAYHADPVPDGSLSSHGARLLLPPNCPALFRHYRENRRPDKPSFDFGHAAHRLVLGAGADLVVVEAENWLTKAAKEQQKAAYVAGRTPLLRKDMAVVEAMAAKILEHPVASALFDPQRGKAEQSAFWVDDETGIWRRARFDWLPHPSDTGRMILPDYKTAVSAEPEAFAKTCATYGYHCQADWYLDAVRALRLAQEVAFVFVVQEKTEPYLVTVAELDFNAMRLARAQNRQAIEVYAECSATNTWPSYSDDVAHISLPAWYQRSHEDLLP